MQYHCGAMGSPNTHLQAGWDAFWRAARHMIGHDPDEIQIQLFDLAVAYAELSAAGSLDEFARSTARSNEPHEDFVQAVNRGYSANVLQELESRLRFAGALDWMKSGVADFIQESASAESQVKVGAMLENAADIFSNDGLSDEKRVMRRSIRQFSDTVVEPIAESVHRNDMMIPEEVLVGVRELGCFGMSVPVEYGGLKPGDSEDTIGMVVVTEELSRGSLGAAGSLITRPEIIVRALLEGGTDQQKEKWLPRLAAGDPLCAVAVTEPDTGSDVASVSLRATRVADGWILNGSKTWCTFAGKAGVVLVLARTDENAMLPHRGLSLFLIEKDPTDDYEFKFDSPVDGSLEGRAIPTLGYRGMHSFQLFFDGFFVPHANLIGESRGEGRGFYYTMRGFSGGRLQTAARASGLMQAAFESTLRYAKERVVFGKRLIDYPLTLAKLAKMATYIKVVKQYAYHVARLMDQGEGQLEASLVKLIACRYAEWVCREALQVHGGIGYSEETDVSRFYVDAKVLSIFEGAEETLALKVVGKAILDEIA